MSDLVGTRPYLTYKGAQLMLEAAIAKATAMGAPQCIAVVDAGGTLLAFARMDGAKYLSVHTALAKARTAASVGKPTWELDETVGVRLALASGGAITALKAGLPLKIDGVIVGGVGVGSGTAEEDMEVVRAAEEAFRAALAESPVTRA